MHATYPPPWFERRFPFPVDAGLLPCLCARLRGTPARLEEALRNHALADLHHKPDGHWSAQENAGHLADMEPLWIARLGDYRDGRPSLTAADLRNRKTDEADHNAGTLPSIFDTFRHWREQLLATVGTLEEGALQRALPHPRLAVPMRVVDHLYFVAEHDDHHLAQIWALLHPAGK